MASSGSTPPTAPQSSGEQLNLKQMDSEGEKVPELEQIRKELEDKKRQLEEIEKSIELHPSQLKQIDNYMKTITSIKMMVVVTDALGVDNSTWTELLEENGEIEERQKVYFQKFEDHLKQLELLKKGILEKERRLEEGVREVEQVENPEAEEGGGA